MLLPQRYPLIDDLGFPNGVRSARERWIESARRERTKARWLSLTASVALTLMLAFFGMVPWMIKRVATPAQLNQYLTSNMPMGNAHLGAEYYNIGSAIAEDRGFSDPFVVQSGPTAWMPPLLVWIQAGLIRLFDGDRYWVMLAVVSLKTLLLCVCGAAIVRQGWNRSDGWIAFGVFAAFVVSEFWACFGFTHDGWLILAGVTATLFGLTRIDSLADASQLTIGKTIAWGCLGGLIALSSPVAGFTWAVGTTLCLWRRASLSSLFPLGFSEFSQPSPALPFRWLLYPLPALAVIGLLIFGRPLSSLQRWAIVIYIAYLIPYVFCSYYPRYGFPLFAVKILLCYWLLERAIVSVRHARARFA